MTKYLGCQGIWEDGQWVTVYSARYGDTVMELRHHSEHGRWEIQPKPLLDDGDIQQFNSAELLCMLTLLDQAQGLARDEVNG